MQFYNTKLGRNAVFEVQLVGGFEGEAARYGKSLRQGNSYVNLRCTCFI